MKRGATNRTVGPAARTAIIRAIGYGLREAVAFSPEGETAAEVLERWEGDNEGVVETAVDGSWWRIHRDIVLTSGERAAVLSLAAAI